MQRGDGKGCRSNTDILAHANVKCSQYSQYIHVPQTQRGFIHWSKCLLIPRHTQIENDNAQKETYSGNLPERCRLFKERWKHSKSGSSASSGLQPWTLTLMGTPPKCHHSYGLHTCIVLLTWLSVNGCPPVLHVAMDITGGISSHCLEPQSLRAPTGCRTLQLAYPILVMFW